MIILGMFIFMTAILIIIFIYNRIVRNNKNKVLKELWKLASKTDKIVGTKIKKLDLINKCNINPVECSIIINKLVKEKMVKLTTNKIEFTWYGCLYYDFKIFPKHNIHG